MTDEVKDKKQEEGQGQEAPKQTEEVKLTPEKVESYLESEEGQKILQPRLDKYFSKGLETWKEKTLPNVIEEEIKKKFPEETEEQKRLRQLEEKLTEAENARVRESAKNKALNYASESGIPAALVEYAVVSDVDKTTENMEKLSAVWKESIKKAVENKFKENGRDVDSPGKQPANLQEEIKAAEAAGDWKKSILLKQKLRRQNKK